MLLCGHTFCEPCYESCATTSESVCPLDGDICGRDDVSTKEYPAEQLLRRKVHCWNKVYGCGVILPASQIAEHVRDHCQHHATCCPTCSAAVLCSDVCAHLKTRCTQLVLHTAPEPQPREDDNEGTNLEALAKMMKQQVGELDAKLARLSFKADSLSDKLSEICINNNDFKEALTAHFVQASGRNLADMKAIYSEKSESLMTAITSALTLVSSDAKTHQRVIRGYAELKEKASKDGRSESMSDKVYLRRYLMSWGIVFSKDGEGVGLSLRIELYEGREDDFLEWPFTKQFKLSVIHPETREELDRFATPDSSDYLRDCFCRPIDGSNTPIHFSHETRIESSDLESDGYVDRDQLLLRLEVLL
ncbi:hypothetical protein HPB48_015959 [Haemaphysalis longicornis]|uniref:TRAF1-6 MATH domain-containing protein n=1 Tax=Haemaphysalis longicornis TaxID=44386 RepID=A0A9J6FSZ2_HAELO|nr:hypothetical protein HPB48_015959 [Haemaphysalis longicornis]